MSIRIENLILIILIKNIIISITMIFSDDIQTINNFSEDIYLQFNEINNKFNKKEIEDIKNTINRYFYQKESHSIPEINIEMFFKELSQLFFHKFINKDPYIFINLINTAIKIDKFTEIFLLNEYLSIDFYNSGKCDLPHPKDKNIKLNKSHIISLLYMIKMNTPLLNILIKYGDKKFSKYFNKLKEQKDGKIKIGKFISFIKNPSHRKNITFELRDLIYEIIIENQKEDIFQFFLFIKYGVFETSKDKFIIKNTMKNSFFSNYLGKPILSIWGFGLIGKNDYLNLFKVYNKDLNKLINHPIFIKSPPYLIINSLEVNEIENIFGSYCYKNYLIWNQNYINITKENFIIYSIQTKGPENYKLTGFITMRIINNGNGRKPNFLFKPYFKYKGNWNEDFNDNFEINPLNNNIEVKEKNLLKIISLFYERVY